MKRGGRTIILGIKRFVLIALVHVLVVYAMAGAALADTQVNTFTTGAQEYPSVAMDANGDFVVVWQSPAQDGSGSGIYAQRYDSSGNPVGSEFQVNTNALGHQTLPAVVMDQDGDFVVAWLSDVPDGDCGSIYAQRYNSEGNPVGPEFQVNDTTFCQYHPTAAMDANGNFVVAWEGAEPLTYGVYAQRYDSSGIPLGIPFRVDGENVEDTHYSPAAAMSTNGNFVVAWHALGELGSYREIYAQLFDSAGYTVRSLFRVNTHTNGEQWYPAAAMDANGNFVVAWQSPAQDGSGFGIYAQRFDNAGNPMGSEFKVNTYTAGNQGRPTVAMDADGDFAVAWQSPAQDGSGFGIYAQRFDSAGNPVGSEFQVNDYTADAFIPTAAMDANGNFVVAWVSGQGGSDLNIYMKFILQDTDEDGIPDHDDNCPFTPNTDQLDANNNGIGDACESDNSGGINALKIVCRNLETRQTLVINGSVASWNCLSSGLTYSPGDRIEMIIKGTAE